MLIYEELLPSSLFSDLAIRFPIIPMLSARPDSYAADVYKYSPVFSNRGRCESGGVGRGNLCCLDRGSAVLKVCPADAAKDHV